MRESLLRISRLTQDLRGSHGFLLVCYRTLSPRSPDYCAECSRLVLVIGLKEFAVVKVCKHPRKVRFLFRDDLYEFLRCEGCGQIVRLPL